MNEILETLQTAVKGRACVVVGSGPVTDAFIPPRPDECVVAVNGGIYSTLGDVDVWVLNARSDQDARGHALYPTMVRQGARRHVGLLVLFTKDEDQSGPETLERLRKQGTTWQHVLEINDHTRRRIETLAGARTPDMTKHALSAGLAAACLCLWADAASVRLEGFSWEPGYAHRTASVPEHRGHIHGDQLALARLGDRVTHSLPLEKDMPRRKVVRTPPKPEFTSDGPRTVRAKSDVWYNDRRYREGAVFTLRKPTDFKPRCMEDVPPGTPPLSPEELTKRSHEDAKTIAQAMAGRRIRPNVADAVPDQTGADVLG